MRSRTDVYFLGVDTSNYTCSLAIIDCQGNLLQQEKELLTVLPGAHGLRQSDAVFQHLQLMPVLIERLDSQYLRNLGAVGVSTRPRDVIGSYMPVFSVGEGFARVLAHACSAPLVNCSHQAGHLAAGLWSVDCLPGDRPLLAVHFSGGTSELLSVQWDDRPKISILGATRDINAGQFIDRVGVALGLEFPAGPALEALAARAEGQLRLTSAVAGYDFSFSGPLSAALRMINTEAPAELARAVEDCIAKALEKALVAASKQTSLREVLLVGGVMANLRIRQRLEHRLRGLKLLFATPDASRDSAIGPAVIARSHIFKVI